MIIVHANQRRTTSTPNGTMTTLASPTLGGATSSLWLVAMNAGAEGPVHAFDGEVLWAITAGTTVLITGDTELDLGPGDTAVLPADCLRQFRAGPEGFTAVASTVGSGEVTRGDGTSAGIPAWVA